MKSWMGGRRRRITVARRDPMIQQRQYFARRREENQQNARRAQVRQTIDSFRRPDRALPDNSTGNRTLGQPLKISTDFLPLANPSALDSIARDLHIPKRPRLEKPRRARHARREEISGGPVPELDLDVSNDIRIFHADVEKTHQFRRRTLPDGFLNSQVTTDDRRRDEREVREHSRKTALGRGSWLDHGRENARAGIVRRRRDTLLQQRRREEVIRTDKPPQARPVMPVHAYHQDIASSERLDPQIDSNRLQSPASPLPDDRAVASHLKDDEIVEGTPSDDEPGSSYKGFLFDISPNTRNGAKPRIPTAKKLLSSLNALSPHFPPVAIDSDSSEALTQYRPTKNEEKYKFRSLLCHEDITTRQFSATLQQLELKLLNLPDRDVSFTAISKGLSDRKSSKSKLLRNANCSDSRFNTMKKSTTKAFASPLVPDISQAELKRPLKIAPGKRSVMHNADRAKIDEKAVRNESDVIPEGRNGSSIGMEVTLGSEARNPVTLAADGAVSEMTVQGVQ